MYFGSQFQGASVRKAECSIFVAGIADIQKRLFPSSWTGRRHERYHLQSSISRNLFLPGRPHLSQVLHLSQILLLTGKETLKSWASGQCFTLNQHWLPSLLPFTQDFSDLVSLHLDRPCKWNIKFNLMSHCTRILILFSIQFLWWFFNGVARHLIYKLK